MSFLKKFKEKVFKDLVEIIEWTDDATNTIIWRFPCYLAEIKNGAQLTVRENQLAVLINDGQVADMYLAGCHQLIARNMPILSALKGWKYDFNSPFKIDVFFVNTKPFCNMRWGSINPIVMHDPEFGPIRLRVFGSYCFSINPDPTIFIRNVVGTHGDLNAVSVSEQLRNFVNTKFTKYLAESKIAVLDLAANLNEFSCEFTIALKDDFSDYGMELIKFMVENISMPEAMEEVLVERTEKHVNGNMLSHAQIENLHIGQPQYSLSPNPRQSTPPTIPSQAMYYVVLNGVQQGPYPITQLKQLLNKGQFTLETLVWTTGMAKWTTADSVPLLLKLFLKNTT